MDFIQVAGTAAGSAGTIYIIGKLIDKVPEWIKALKGRRNGNGNEDSRIIKIKQLPTTEKDVKLIVQEHQSMCLEKLNKRFDDIKDHVDNKTDHQTEMIIQSITGKRR